MNFKHDHQIGNLLSVSLGPKTSQIAFEKVWVFGYTYEGSLYSFSIDFSGIWALLL